jgi:hypothetical protein
LSGEQLCQPVGAAFPNLVNGVIADVPGSVVKGLLIQEKPSHIAI